MSVPVQFADAAAKQNQITFCVPMGHGKDVDASPVKLRRNLKINRGENH